MSTKLKRAINGHNATSNQVFSPLFTPAGPYLFALTRVKPAPQAGNLIEFAISDASIHPIVTLIKEIK